MKINVIIVGKVENKQYSELVDLYLKRIKHYIPISLTIVKPEKIKNLSTNEIISIEEERILEKLNPPDYSISMDVLGESISSENFAKMFTKLAQQSTKTITFIIGGPLGLGKEVVKKSSKKISLSKFTMTHELALVVLLEQIYRGQTILRGEKYHK